MLPFFSQIIRSTRGVGATMVDLVYWLTASHGQRVESRAQLSPGLFLVPYTWCLAWRVDTGILLSWLVNIKQFYYNRNGQFLLAPFILPFKEIFVQTFGPVIEPYFGVDVRSPSGYFRWSVKKFTRTDERRLAWVPHATHSQTEQRWREWFVKNETNLRVAKEVNGIKGSGMCFWISEHGNYLSHLWTELQMWKSGPHFRANFWLLHSYFHRTCPQLTDCQTWRVPRTISGVTVMWVQLLLLREGWETESNRSLWHAYQTCHNLFFDWLVVWKPTKTAKLRNEIRLSID